MINTSTIVIILSLPSPPLARLPTAQQLSQPSAAPAHANMQPPPPETPTAIMASPCLISLTTSTPHSTLTHHVLPRQPETTCTLHRTRAQHRETHRGPCVTHLGGWSHDGDEVTARDALDWLSRAGVPWNVSDGEMRSGGEVDSVSLREWEATGFWKVNSFLNELTSR